MITSALKWIGGVDGYLEVVDQRKLPLELVRTRCESIEQVYDAIRSLAVRGAPAIGVAGAYGLVLALRRNGTGGSAKKELECLRKAGEYLAGARPTAVNLAWAVGRIVGAAESFVAEHPQAAAESIRQAVFSEANSIFAEDVDMCRRIGIAGQKFIKDGVGVLTHCNAGALATAGQGTALSVMFEAHRMGRRFTVYVDETRPVLQGARLTAWELKQAGIDAVLICDSAAGWLMKQKKVDVVITGADRITANGDTANKVGTYALSVLARQNGLTFCVAAPSSSFDLSMASGEDIPIEHRDACEVTRFAGVQVAPEGVSVFNCAFDVTPAENISAIITEKGVIEGPDRMKITKCLELSR